MHWLNDNSGAIQALATIVLVLVTIGYVLFTRWMVSAMREQSGPYLSLTLRLHGGLEWVLKNTGLRVARDVTVRALKEPPLRQLEPLKQVRLSRAEPFGQTYPSLAPDKDGIFGIDVNVGRLATDGENTSWELWYRLKYRDGRDWREEEGRIGWEELKLLVEDANDPRVLVL